ncbi:hypothetical protein EFK50_07690 [Nocardioides marmoriginsengisoli]|uniref:Uncharacterized protein n=1 Tax=Nocardioides marmoriginsengisoli TaxID=661483 RepID=A0A3N0CLQ6_9ACTN|nr:hypothetical protein [Nocardioides marmoriginsengisoli]RNL64397.1 hypothetical protein EFK50_07690 [Nocardioides marmoriginsengisoli]
MSSEYGTPCIWVMGADDLIAQPSMDVAIRLSQEMNAAYGRYLIEKDIDHDPLMPIAWAVPTTFEIQGVTPPVTDTSERDLLDGSES